MKTVECFFRKIGNGLEYCFYVETSAPLTTSELKILKWFLAETFEPENFGSQSFLFRRQRQQVVELGPRLNFETASSTNAVAICQACGLNKVTRLEYSRRHILTTGTNRKQFVHQHHDRMTECEYQKPLRTFETGSKPQSVQIIPLLEQGRGVLARLNTELGLGMDDWDITFYYDLFTKVLGRNPTDVECFQLGQANSEHCRHWFFKGRLIIDGQLVPETLLEIIRSTLVANPENSVIAFSDNSSAIKGYTIWTILPTQPGQCSSFSMQQCTCHILFTAETHNFPSGIEPFEGAATGTGGRLRDGQATGRGSLVIAGTAGYCTGNLRIADYPIPGEDATLVYHANLAPPLTILIRQSDGASDYGNKFGEPVILGFVRTCGLDLPSGERREWLKPIMFTGGIGQMDSRHTKKAEPKKGMLVVQVGGPAFRIGFGGGGASSMISGQSTMALDFKAVQRANGEMENKLNRVIRACVEMGERNPILAIHDQGAGGPANVLMELVAPAGGRIEIRNIKVGDATMSVIEIWGAEYQERDAFLIAPDRIAEFQAICQREKVNCEVLGEITGDGRIVVHDKSDDSIPVDLPLERILGKMPQKTFRSEYLPRKLEPLELPTDLTIAEALRLVFRLPQVGSKNFLVRKVDRSVTGLIAQQQCCGPLQLPVADVAVVAQSHFGLTGAATAIGEQPIKGLIDVAAGARMAVAEMLTNLASARVSSRRHIKCSVNWMWPAKLPGEGALIYDAAVALRDLMIKLGAAADGGKDSLSMAAKVDEQMVKAPGQVVVSGYVTMPDITRVVTPDIKRPGESQLLLIDLGAGKNRLGGSALAQCFGQIGDETPDVDDPELLARAFDAIQELISRDLICACHDISDGGLITTLVEMAMAGNCGFAVELPKEGEVISQLFAEELGWVLEYLPKNRPEIRRILQKFEVPYHLFGKTYKAQQAGIWSAGGKKALELPGIRTLRQWWEATSDRIEGFQRNPEQVKQLVQAHDRPEPTYQLSFQPKATAPEILLRSAKPKVAIIREEGTNGDREMTSAFFDAAFEPWDVTMTDLLKGGIKLGRFKGVVFPGGFSYADVLDSAKGWAGTIRFNPKLSEMFTHFYQRSDTFSLGVCNGCQLMALLGWVPWFGIPEIQQPRFIRNSSGKFESRWVTIKVQPSPAVMFKEMADSALGIWVAHGEGQLHCPEPKILERIGRAQLSPLVYVDDLGLPTEQYPFNPNGSPQGIAALCSPNGRHLAMMPHPERLFRCWQWPYWPKDWPNRRGNPPSPWLKMFQNAREWCDAS